MRSESPPATAIRSRTRRSASLVAQRVSGASAATSSASDCGPLEQRLLVGQHLGEQPAGEHLLRLHEPRTHHHVLEARNADQGRGAAVVRHRQAVAEGARDGESVPRGRRSDAQVAACGDGSAGAGARAVDRSDGRHAHGLERAHEPISSRLVVQGVLLGLERSKLRDVGAGHKGLPAGPGQDRRTCRAVGVDVVTGLLQALRTCSRSARCAPVGG